MPRAKWLGAGRANRAMESLVWGVPNGLERGVPNGLERGARIMLWKAGRELRIGMLGRDGLSNKQ